MKNKDAADAAKVALFSLPSSFSSLSAAEMSCELSTFKVLSFVRIGQEQKERNSSLESRAAVDFVAAAAVRVAPLGNFPLHFCQVAVLSLSLSLSIVSPFFLIPIAPPPPRLFSFACAA